MARAKSVSSRSNKKTMKMARGFKQARSNRVHTAKEAVLHAGQYAYVGRKDRKSNMRKLWITRLNAAVHEHGLTYNKFVNLLKKGKVEINKKVLSDLAIRNKEAFKQLVDKINDKK
jgi:large subunit ribosomal protein L20